MNNNQFADLKSLSQLSQTNAYVQAMRALQDKIKNMEYDRGNRLNEYEKQIQKLRSQLEDKEKLHLQTLDELQSHRSHREEQLSRKIQDLLNTNHKLQLTIHQQSLDYKELRMQYDQLLIKYQEVVSSNTQSQMPIISRKISQNHENPSIQKLDLNQLSAKVSPRIIYSKSHQIDSNKQSIQHSLHEFIEEVKVNNQIPNTNQNSLVSLLTKQQARKSIPKIFTPVQTFRTPEQEEQIKQLNEKYEQLIRDAQRENDYKKKAFIRKQLLEIADQIKEINKQR